MSPVAGTTEAPLDIIVLFVQPPIPARNHNYQATRGPADEGCLVGWGATRQAAIDELLDREAAASDESVAQ